MIIKQLKTGGFDDNFSYILADEKSREGMVIDPCGNVEKILEEAKKDAINIKYVVNTHTHLDHTQGNREVMEATEAKLVCHKLDASPVSPDITVDDGDMLKLGDAEVKILHTPGHTRGGICLLAENALFSGDTLFVGFCGRTDSSGGSSEQLYHSLFDRIANLPDETKVYPGHDYGEKPVSTVGYEKKHNPYYKCKTKQEFIELRRRGV